MNQHNTGSTPSIHASTSRKYSAWQPGLDQNAMKHSSHLPNSWSPPTLPQKPTKSGSVPPPSYQGWSYRESYQPQSQARSNIYEHLNRESEFQEEDNFGPSDTAEQSEFDFSRKQKAKALHIYDFDNTLFSSPVPNPSLFNESSRMLLEMEDGINGSCWQREPCFLQNLGMGFEKERQRGWKWFWNEDVVKLARLSIADEEVIAVLISEREETLFSWLINEILRGKGLNFDLVLIKGESTESDNYKATAVGDLLDRFDSSRLDEITMYDNDSHQTNSVQQVAKERSISFLAIPVSTKTSHLNPLAERELVEGLVEEHNKMVREEKHSHLNQMAVRKSIFQTAYLVEMESRRKLIDHCIRNQSDFLPVDEVETMARLKFCCDTIPITFNQVSKGEMTRLGGLGCPVLFGTAYCGCLSGRLYAIKLLCNKEEFKSATGEEPILIVAVGPDEEGGYDYKYEDVKQITEWHIADEMIDIRCQIGYKQLLKIQPVSKKNVEYTGQREIQ